VSVSEEAYQAAEQRTRRPSGQRWTPPHTSLSAAAQLAATAKASLL
jgi:hypothetical protein